MVGNVACDRVMLLHDEIVNVLQEAERWSALNLTIAGRNKV